MPRPAVISARKPASWKRNAEKDETETHEKQIDIEADLERANYRWRSARRHAVHRSRRIRRTTGSWGPVERMEANVLAAEVGKDEKPSQPPERLYGTWTAKDVDAKMGEVKIRLTFRREKKVTLLAWSDISSFGQVRDLKGAFSVQGDTISSEAIRDGKKAKFFFENDQLVLHFKSDKVVRFDRE
ncbi:MAG: hypothetical protein IPL59_10290 [Candidatus Competibacteraceae bacterium]|nr:hypothetical protein [Candidatus Competibacteraceae bacterium]